MDRATVPATPSPIGNPRCGNGGGFERGGGWPNKVSPSTVRRSGDKDEEDVEEAEKCSKTKRKKKKRKKGEKEVEGGGKWTFGGLFRRRKKKEEDQECAKESTEEEYGVTSLVKGGNLIVQQSMPNKRTKDEEFSERLVGGGGHPCSMHNGCSGCVGASHPGRSRQRPTFGSGSDCGRDVYVGTGLVRRDSSTSSHKERKELIKARVEAMRERLPRDSSSEDEMLPGGGSEGSWEYRVRRVPLPPGPAGHPLHPAGSVGSAGSSPYLGRRSRFTGRTERFHQRRVSREYRDEAEEEEMWRKRPNGLPPQCIPWRASQSDAEAPYLGCRAATAASGSTIERGGIGSGSALSHSPAPSPMNSPMLGGRRSVSSATSPAYGVDSVGLPLHGSNRCIPRRYPSSPISPQAHTEGQSERGYGPPQASLPFPTRSRSTDLLLCWRPEEGRSHQPNEPNPFHFPSPTPKQPIVQRNTHEPNHQFHHHARWPSAPSRSPPPPPPPRDPQRRIATPQSFSHFVMRESTAPLPAHHDVGGFVTRRNYHQQQTQPPHAQQLQENPYMNVEVQHVHIPMSGGTQGVQTCLADSQPRSRRPLRVTQGGAYYGARPGEVSYMSDSQVGSVGRKQIHPILMQHPPLESHYAVPFMADSPPPRCMVNRVLKEPQVAEGVIHNSRPLMRQQRLPVLSRSRSSSPAPVGVNNRPPHLHIRPLDGSNENHPFAQRGHSSAPQTPIDAPINRPLSIVSEEKGDVSPRIPPIPPARSSSRRSSISSLEAMDYGVWAMDRPSKATSRGPSGLEDAITELENIYKSLKFEDEVDGETDSNAMGSSELGLPFDDQDRPLTDDMAYRRLHSKEKTSPTAQHGVGGIVAQAGSYLLVSPTLGPADPWTEPPPNSVNPGEPDITLDDVVFRSVRQANAHIPQDPQPPFGIPLGPVTRAPESDYLHVKPPSPSPTARAASISAKKTPDVVKDDLAFRSLRKDRLPNGSPVPLRGVSSPPPRPSSSFSCVSSPPPLPTPGVDFQAIRKKRAVRSLSANLLGILQTASITARSSSPPLRTPSALPLQSSPSPRKELHEVSFPPPSSPTSKSSASLPQQMPSNNPSMSPMVPNEEYEPYNAENRTLVNDATSSDTLTEGHADEPRKKLNSTKELCVERIASPVQSLMNSPGEVYEALGRVLSRVGKDSDTTVKGTKVKSEEDDDLESLLAALAKEARATSENLGRELDQLRTSSVKISDGNKIPGTKSQVATSGVLSSSPHTQFRMESMTKAESAADELKRSKSYCNDRSSSPRRIGAIASLALRGLEKPRALSSSSSPDSAKMDDLSVVVGKCTVGTDTKHPGSIVSFTSSVSPIKSSAKYSSGRMDNSDQVMLVSTTSVDSPMKSVEDSHFGKKESPNVPSEVSTTSAGIPIKSDRLGLEVDGKSDQLQGASIERSEQRMVCPDPIIASRDSETMTHLSTSVKYDVKSMVDRVNSARALPNTPNVRQVVSRIEDNMQVKSSAEKIPRIPFEEGSGKKLSMSSNASRDINSLNESPPSTLESTPITGSMRLVVRRDLENYSDAASPQSPYQCNWLVRTETEPTQSSTQSLSEDMLRKTNNSVTVSGESRPITSMESAVKSFGEVGFVFVGSDRSSVPSEKQPATQASPPTAVVEEIQKEFDQLLFTIPAKKPRKSDESESSKEFSSPVRLRVTESKSLEHPRRATREVRMGQDSLRKTFPKYLGSSLAKTSSAVRSSDSVAASKESRTSDEVSHTFEREFEELWKASTKNDGNERNRIRTTTVGLDGALERQLDQLNAEVKREAKEVDPSDEVFVMDTSKESSPPGERDAAGEVCPTVLLSSGHPEDGAKQASSAAAACALKPAVAASAPACLTLKAICYPCKTASNVQALDQTDSSFCSSMVTGFIPEPGDPLFTAMAAFLALVTLIAALIVRPY